MEMALHKSWEGGLLVGSTVILDARQEISPMLGYLFLSPLAPSRYHFGSTCSNVSTFLYYAIYPVYIQKDDTT